MNLRLNEKVVVITGGGTGIGLAAAIECASEGAYVCILGRRDGTLQQACMEAKAQNLTLYTYAVDITDAPQLHEISKQIANRFTGGIDVWVNNAGSFLAKPLLSVSQTDWHSIMDVNLYAVLLGVQAAVPYMQHGGVIINASSFAAKIPNASSGVYAIAKSGVTAMTRVLAAELAPKNIRVVGYMPGPIKTPMTNNNSSQDDKAQLSSVVLRRRGEAQEVGKLVAFLASDASSYISGVDVEISGGKFAVQNPGYYWN